MKLRAALAADLGRISSLLQAEHLPVEDLRPGNLDGFLVAYRDAAENGDIAGLVGLERYAEAGLLRSLVVLESARGSGLGARLLGKLEQMAVAAGVRELWLLTNDADAYFEKFGYRARDRDDAPASIRQTEQFSTLCPGTAVLMSKTLAAD